MLILTQAQKGRGYHVSAFFYWNQQKGTAKVVSGVPKIWPRIVK
jgi:hypothetical protein